MGTSSGGSRRLGPGSRLVLVLVVAVSVALTGVCASLLDGIVSSDQNGTIATAVNATDYGFSLLKQNLPLCTQNSTGGSSGQYPDLCTNVTLWLNATATALNLTGPSMQLVATVNTTNTTCGPVSAELWLRASSGGDDGLQVTCKLGDRPDGWLYRSYDYNETTGNYYPGDYYDSDGDGDGDGLPVVTFNGTTNENSTRDAELYLSDYYDDDGSGWGGGPCDLPEYFNQTLLDALGEGPILRSDGNTTTLLRGTIGGNNVTIPEVMGLLGSIRHANMTPPNVEEFMEGLDSFFNKTKDAIERVLCSL